MGYICMKGCKIGGKRHNIGDPIDIELIAPGREGALINMGLIAKVPGATAAIEPSAMDEGKDQQAEDVRNAPDAPPQSRVDELQGSEGAETANAGKDGKCASGKGKKA